jgi:hypothetical protein
MRNSVLAVLLLAGLAANVFAQTGNASLGGIVEDPSKALIPGVTITAKNVDTAVTVTQVTNESGVYNFPTPVAPSFAAGTFGVSANKVGERSFQGQLRVNF